MHFSHGNVCLKLCQCAMHSPQTQPSSPFHLMAQKYLTHQYVILRHCSPNLCKRNYLYGNLPFYKIQVNCFMAWDESFGARLSQNASYGGGAW